jgi:homoserine kinase type II
MAQPDTCRQPAIPPVILDVARAFGLKEISSVTPLGGTATPKYAVVADRTRYVVRIRPDEAVRGELARFHHQCLLRASDAGLPVPRPLMLPDGTSWVTREGRTYELLSWVDGEPYRFGDETAVSSAASFLAGFHRALRNDTSAPASAKRREDHPDLIEPYAEALVRLCRDNADREVARVVMIEVRNVRKELDSGVYGSLPQVLIHGDFHTGNVSFTDSSVSAVYDFDYVSRQARIRDVCDGLIFFASRRARDLDPHAIRSLTQPFLPDQHLCAVFLNAYQRYDHLTDAEWRAIPWIIRSRWLQMRLRGGRKVPEAERFGYITSGIFEVLSWIDTESDTFFENIRRQGET